jgi:ParB family chromosome partitioning protein
MTMQSIPLSAILPPKNNPRSAIDQDGIESLAASILADGLLQNLVVIRAKGKKPRYHIISGERRYRALTLLVERSQIAADYPVNVDLRTDLTDEDVLRLSTVENVLRENLSPLDEAAAFAQLVQQGAVLEDLAAQTGLNRTTIKRRLALANLSEEAKAALQTRTITLAQAEALTLGTHEAQRDILTRLEHGYDDDADDIRHILLNRKPTVAMALFQMEEYEGTLTTDLFAEEDASYFDDVEQFFALQRQAVANLAKRYEETADWVEVTECRQIQDWHYDSAEEGERGGVLINLAPSGEVEVRERLVRHTIEAETAAETADTPLAPARARPEYATPLCRYMAYRKSMAVQHTLFNHPRKAKEVAVVLMLGASDWPCVNLTRHACLGSLAQEDTPPIAYQAVEQHALRLAKALNLPDDWDFGEEDDKTPGWERLLDSFKDTTKTYEAVKALSDEDLDDLHLLLPVLSFGQGNCDQVDTGDSLFNRVASDLGVDMRAYWRPDTAFLSRRTKPQLLEITAEIGLNKEGQVAKLKKSELVRMLASRFERAVSIEEPGENDRKARDWLPEAMRFPTPPSAAEDTPVDEDTCLEDIAA